MARYWRSKHILAKRLSWYLKNFKRIICLTLIKFLNIIVSARITFMTPTFLKILESDSVGGRLSNQITYTWNCLYVHSVAISITGPRKCVWWRIIRFLGFLGSQMRTMDCSSPKAISPHFPLSHSALGSHIYTPSLDLLNSQIKCDQPKWHQYTWIHQPLRSRISLWLCGWSGRNQGAGGFLCLSQIPVIWAQLGPGASALVVIP